jgi:hypothetical protein
MNKLVDTTGSEARRLPAEWQSGIAMARKYATSGPRYTSYPTAPQFSDDFDLQRYLNWQGQGTARRPPVDLRPPALLPRHLLLLRLQQGCNAP